MSWVFFVLFFLGDKLVFSSHLLSLVFHLFTQLFLFSSLTLSM